MEVVTELRLMIVLVVVLTISLIIGAVVVLLIIDRLIKKIEDYKEKMDTEIFE